jgi:hypothetical protein
MNVKFARQILRNFATQMMVPSNNLFAQRASARSKAMMAVPEPLKNQFYGMAVKQSSLRKCFVRWTQPTALLYCNFSICPKY